MSTRFFKEIFNIRNEADFQILALKIFNYQYENNVVYREYSNQLGRKPSAVNKITDLPFLPVELFRNHIIVSGSPVVKVMFESSGTSSEKRSRHYVTDLALYEKSFLTCFRQFFGEPGNFAITALLPSYTERKNSSLVYMVNNLVKLSGDKRSGFYSNNKEELLRVLGELRKEGKNSLLIGVSFALLDLAEEYSPDLKGISVIETGGMKGRRKELTREELHSRLKEGFNIDNVCSEYGMTELLSQAWSKANGVFHTPPWMRVYIRDLYNPLELNMHSAASGGINIIDLANINSCSFISTADLGRQTTDGGFEVLGRFDNSDVRGCNLLAD